MMVQRKNRNFETEYLELYNYWLECSNEISKNVMAFINSDNINRPKLFTNWEDYSTGMNRYLKDFTKVDETWYNEMNQLWQKYSKKLTQQFNDLKTPDNSTFSNLFQTWLEYSTKQSKYFYDRLQTQIEEHWGLDDWNEFWMNFYGTESLLNGKKVSSRDDPQEIASIVTGHWMKLARKTQGFSQELLAGDDDYLGKYQELFKYWSGSYSDMCKQIMRTQAYAKWAGTTLDRSLEVKKQLDNISNQNLKNLGLPTKADMNEVHKNLNDINSEIRKISNNLESMTSGNRGNK